MTAARRIREKMTKILSPGLLAGLALVVLPVVGCGQDSNNNLKSGGKPIGTEAGNVDHDASFRSQAQSPPMVADEVLVRFNSDTTPEAIERIQAELHLETVRKFRSSNLYLMKITDGTAVEAIIRKLKTYPPVKYAEPNYVVKANPQD
jgi:Fervidolysin N-terminal prodomain